MTWSPIFPGADWNGGPSIRYHYYVVLEGALSINAVWLFYSTSLGWNCELSRMDECEASGNVCEESKQDDTSCSSDSDLGYPA